MSTTTKKHRAFVNEPMEGKYVDDVPGIGAETASRLRRSQYGSIRTAKELYGHFLVLRKCECKFKHFIMEHGGNTRNQTAAYRAFKDWDDNFN